MKKIFFCAVVLTAIMTSCKKPEGAFDASVNGPLSVEFDNIAGTADLQLNSGTYMNTSSESFKLTRLKYYVSNFSLTKTDGTVCTVPQNNSYFLIDESAGTEQLAELEVPEGEYKTLQFTLGVDSLRSTKNISERTGVLDPAAHADMYIDQNTGYVLFNAEGTSASAPGGTFAYHIAGYGGMTVATVNNVKTITLDLTARGTPKVKNGKETNIHLMVDMLKIFSGATNFSIASHPFSSTDAFSSTVAANLATMFRHDHTEN